ncbi:MAG: phenylalanine--tRNA ligase subunit beta [Candidatus Dormibacteria bacterium]
MKISLEWLREYATLDAPIDTLVRALVDTGTEVDRVERHGEGVVVAEVIALVPVPESTRGVQFATIEVGALEPLRVLTGASNIAVGDLVPYAPPGTQLPGFDEPLGVRAMFGGKYHSPGMLCSAVELGTGDDAEGILKLDHGRPGQPVHEVLALDVLLDVEVTPNRPDCLCHVGIARELTAAMGEALHEPSAVIAEGLVSASGAGQKVTLHIEEPDGCPRFAVRVIENVAVETSPLWLQRRLRAIGQRPINTVVDITNYVAHELGQPLHAFDLDRFTEAAGGRPAAVVVRRARAGENLLCLDGIDRELGSTDLVVCSGAIPASVAGIIGGQSTAVDGATHNVLLEAASWEPTSIRASSKQLGVRTDASTLYEKGLPDELPILALERAASLIAELAHGHVLRDRLDERANPLPVTPPIEMTARRLGAILGYPVDVSEAATALAHLGFSVEEERDQLTVQPPYFRRDVRIVEDVAEEVGRSLGYDRVPSTLPGRRAAATNLAATEPLDERIRNVCVEAGYDEVLPYVFTRPDTANLLPGLGEGRDLLALRNPLSDDWTHLRAGLLPGLAQTLALNLNRGVSHAAIFELGRVFWEGERRGQPAGSKPDGIDAQLLALPAEPLLLAVAVHVPDGAGAAAEGLRGVQSLLQSVAHDLGCDLQAHPDAISGLRPGRAAWLQIDGRRAGVLGELDAGTVDAFSLRGRVVVGELRLDAVVPVDPPTFRYHPLPRYPAVVQDLAVSVSGDSAAGVALAVIREAGGPLLESVELYDEFRSERLGQGNKGWTFRLSYRSPDRTLTSDEAQQWQRAIALALRQRCGAQVRR